MSTENPNKGQWLATLNITVAGMSHGIEALLDHYHRQGINVVWGAVQEGDRARVEFYEAP